MESLEENECGKMCKVVVDYTKKKSPYGDRFIPISDYEISIFKKIKDINIQNHYEAGEFVFCDSSGRTNIRSIDNLIRKCCNHAGIEVKSAHDIRRTVASEMFNNTVPVEIIKDYLGHSDIKTTFGYILDNKGKAATRKKILDSLENFNGLKGTQVP